MCATAMRFELRKQTSNRMCDNQGQQKMAEIDTLRDAYLDLLRDTIINAIYDDPGMAPLKPWQFLKSLAGQKHRVKGFDATKRESGLDWPSVAHSMIGRKRMDNLRQCLTDVIGRGVPGDFVETGVWRGGACILARGILRAYSDSARKVWVCDSFEGLPPPDAKRYAADKGDKHYKNNLLAVGVEQVQDNFRRYGLLDHQVQFLKAWFKDTLPGAPISAVSVLRLDGDMYESTMDALRALYAKVSDGGYVIVDDYHAVAGCRQAVHDFIAAEYPAEPLEIHEIDGVGVYWKRAVRG
jgi:O-methyltransferase